MSPFEFIDHTADIGLRVRAESLEELFADAATGMFEIVLDEMPSGWDETRLIELEAPDTESLLVNWLGELLYIFEVKKFIPRTCRVKIREGKSLAAEVEGLKMEGSVYGTEVKAVTHHLLEIVKTVTGDYEVDVYFDL